MFCCILWATVFEYDNSNARATWQQGLEPKNKLLFVSNQFCFKITFYVIPYNTGPIKSHLKIHGTHELSWNLEYVYVTCEIIPGPFFYQMVFEEPFVFFRDCFNMVQGHVQKE